MNRDELYEDNYWGDGTPIYYMDPECSVTYTGHLEEYDEDQLIYEADIVDGLEHGITKSYDDGFLCIAEKRRNRSEGLTIGYNRKSKIVFIELYYRGYILQSYSYTEAGTQREINRYFRSVDLYSDLEDYNRFIKKYDIEKINEDILQFGEPIHYYDKFPFFV